ncbi:hypothetical protein AJ80_00987 [Polytolypa hystricis UAMH7299]|uniref:Geranylgeranyl transferase type-2 subunit alpha n=1 Tax=Polytolypa hystricis (strain UAMH7299) TaxID=1447883 RepID=A0A2B7Z371_POLH7|nr:hypothetical protein AJ80_00987 [Polytolypa hystricis UAMH7299]
MASHGVPRYDASSIPRSEESRQQEAKKIQKYKQLVELVREKRANHEYTKDTLSTTSEVLSMNPEYYTVWNTRRLVLKQQFSEVDPEGREDNVRELIKAELQFLFPLLRSHPKCYWVWNHRLWNLEQTTALLPTSVSRKFWQEELALVGKMLSLDSRNFLGWGYRREVVAALERLATKDDGAEGRSMAKDEFGYTSKMIGANLSNFSAWHNRTQLILRMLNEQSASDGERKHMLVDGDTLSFAAILELKLLHRALIDPYDQSLWFYHQNLICCFDPTVASRSIAPNLTNTERLEFLHKEVEAIMEVLDEVDDSKWVYQALIDCSTLIARIEGKTSAEAQKNLSGWLRQLKMLDPLRQGRWIDLERSLKLGTASA